MPLSSRRWSASALTGAPSRSRACASPRRAAGASEAMKTPHEPSSDYIRFDEIEDVVVSAELVAHLAPLLDTHPSYWKWVIVAAHNAMQGAMVCALTDSTGTSVLDESAKKVLDWHNAGMRGDP